VADSNSVPIALRCTILSRRMIVMSTGKTEPSRPHDWPAMFTKLLHTGDIDGMLGLYAADACFARPNGDVLIGHEQLRPVLTSLVKEDRRMESEVIQAVVSDDIAVLYTDFRGTRVDTAGERVDVRDRAIEVLRRQSDGSWKLIIGDPKGRQR
jgi:uncharacterized protein (TIGR02246 family)